MRTGERKKSPPQPSRGWRGREWLRDLVGVGPGPVTSLVEQSLGKRGAPGSIPGWVAVVIFSSLQSSFSFFFLYQNMYTYIYTQNCRQNCFGLLGLISAVYYYYYYYEESDLECVSDGDSPKFATRHFY